MVDFPILVYWKGIPKVPAHPRPNWHKKNLKKWIIHVTLFWGVWIFHPKKNETVWEKKSHGSTSGDRSVNGMMIFFADPRDSKGGGFLGFGIATFRGVFDHIFRSDPTHIIPLEDGPLDDLHQQFMFICFGISFEFVGVERGKCGGPSSQGPCVQNPLNLRIGKIEAMSTDSTGGEAP